MILFRYGFAAILFTVMVHGQNMYNRPESVFYDVKGNRYFASNQETGEIVEIDSSGNTRIWNNEMSVMRGITIYGNTLYAACGETLAGFDLTSAQKTLEVHIPGVETLNDVCVDSTGMLYVTCPPKGRLYKMAPASGKYHIYLTGIPRPNGCMYQHSHGRVLVLNWGDNRGINTVSITDSTQKDVIPLNLSNLDGADEDNLGRIYLSSWKTNAIYRVDKEISKAPEIIMTGLNGPADISYNRYQDVLCIPNMKDHEIILKQMEPTGVKMIFNRPEMFRLHPNAPNPFNPSTRIRYALDRVSDIDLSIYSVRGELIRRLYSGRQTAGDYQIDWHGQTDAGFQAPSGQYVCRLVTATGLKSLKLCLIR